MDQNDVFDFAKMLKGPLVLRKTDKKKQKFIWNKCQWFKYNDNFGQIAFKRSLDHDEELEWLSLRRPGKLRNRDIEVERTYNQMVPITQEKKKDLINLLPLIPPIYHSFYKGLNSGTQIEDNDPDFEDMVVDSELVKKLFDCFF